MNHKINRWQSLILKVCLSFIVASVIYLAVPTKIHQTASAQSDLTLKSDIISLKARLNRVEQEVNNLRSSSTRPRNSVPKQQSNSVRQNSNPPLIDGQSIGSSDPMFQRLATLVIELKEDLRNIDERLTELEEQP